MSFVPGRNNVVFLFFVFREREDDCFGSFKTKRVTTPPLISNMEKTRGFILRVTMKIDRKRTRIKRFKKEKTDGRHRKKERETPPQKKGGGEIPN